VTAWRFDRQANRDPAASVSHFFVETNRGFMAGSLFYMESREMDIKDFIGIIAAIGTTSSFIPQVYKVFKTKKTDDLSLGMFLLFCVGTLLWTIYGFIVHSLPIIIANSMTFVLASYILSVKIKSKR
jgi:MtN3 and saliva related transmembrane protein